MSILCYLLQPPYDEASSVKCENIPADVSIPRGGVIAIRPGDADGWAAVLAAVAAVSASICRAPVVVWSQELATEALFHLAEHGPAVGIRSIMTVPVIDRATLRRALCEPDLMDSHVIHWLRRRGMDVEPALEDMIGRISAAGGSEATIRAALKARGGGYGSWARATQAAGFARSEDAFQVFRLLRICLDLQRDPLRSLASSAESFGYEDTAALRRRLREAMGTTPSEVRQHLGWEWLLFQALRRVGIPMQACA